MIVQRSLWLVVIVALLVSGGVNRAQEPDRVLRAAIDQEATSLNPYFTVQAAAYMFIDLYLLRPWIMDDNLQYAPILVEQLPNETENGITQNDQGQTVVRFTLADWAMWSDGTPVTAEDFIFPFDVSQDGISGMVVTTFEDVASVEQGANEREIIVTFKDVYPDWFDAGWWPLPAHVLREPYEAALADNRGLGTLEWNIAPTLSNGPFAFAEWQSGSFMRFERNESFHDPAWFEDVIVNFYADPTVMRTIIANGAADVAHNFQPSDVLELVDDPNIVIDSQYDSGREALWFNLGRDPHPAVLDARVRRAIAMGLNRQLMVDVLMGGLTEVPHSFWDDTPYYNEALEPITYDPDGARALLNEAGWRDADGDGICEAEGIEGVEDGTPLTLSLGTTTASIRLDTQAVIQDMLGDICVDLELSNYESAIWATPFTDGGGFRGGYDDILLFYGWTAFSSASAIPWFTCENIPSEDNPNGINVAHRCWDELDALWDAIDSTLDPAERQQYVDEAQVFMAEEMMWIGLWNRPQLTVYRADIENVRPGGQAPYWQVSAWERSG